MYLSQLTLNLKNKDARRDLSNGYELHRTLAKLVAIADGVQPSFLFQALPQQQKVLLLSQNPPNLSHVDAQYFDAFDAPRTKAFMVQVENEQILQFRLFANPTKEDFKTKKRVSLLQTEQQLDWLNRKGALHGFQVLNVQTQSEWTGNYGQFIQEKHKSNIPRIGVLFQGMLQVTDPNLFQETLKKGIGKGKAFGFGLLCIAPA